MLPVSPPTLLSVTSLVFTGIASTMLFRKMGNLQKDLDEISAHAVNYGVGVDAAREENRQLKLIVARLSQAVDIQQQYLNAIHTMLKQEGKTLQLDASQLLHSQASTGETWSQPGQRTIGAGAAGAAPAGAARSGWSQRTPAPASAAPAPGPDPRALRRFARAGAAPAAAEAQPSMSHGVQQGEHKAVGNGYADSSGQSNPGLAQEHHAYGASTGHYVGGASPGMDASLVGEPSTGGHQS